MGRSCLVRQRRGGMSSQRPARRWGKTDAALVIAAAAIVPKWSRWLNERQTERKRVEGEDGEEAEWVLYRPTSALHLAQGFGTTFGYLALLDLLVARRVVQHGQNCRPAAELAAVGPRAWAAGPCPHRNRRFHCLWPSRRLTRPRASSSCTRSPTSRSRSRPRLTRHAPSRGPSTSLLVRCPSCLST